ncbi:HNH endonuclease [Aeromicrobium chenweiae]|uniref:HNH endonuclease n=1 Tax=Aeromicrobium chenweiae TaxID=2079793 RepID=A0A2S0WK53_9ACTN|nr:HNH endonuclease signature motif containing protein [Aeromicrobium chenweiae]AWB91620.1 HNH endonuclease [Aeromicrobium chenweiae]TGN32459.1 HNH endonuclease [Aeromicrobium chenweiae]
MNPEPTIDAMRTAAQTLSSGDTREKLHAVQAAQDALDAAKAVLLAELQAAREFELDGASTLNTWVRNQLRLNAGQATRLVRNVNALRDLPLVAEAATTGQISAAHVQVFVYGLAHVGLDPMREYEEALVTIACERDPDELFDTVKRLKDRTHPEDLDDAWRGGMEKEDFAVDALPEGWHISGFLNALTGLKLKKVLDSVSAPHDAEDTRTGAQRRVQGLDDLLSSILGNGLPSDKGVRPHMSVFVDAETVEAAAERVRQETEQPNFIPDPMPVTEPATLAGHGAIGPHLLMFLFCMSGITGFVRDQDQVLNVGRTKYEPNLKQRKAVLARQKGICAAPGCNHTHLEVHHSVWWSLGGSTDLDQLVGLCVRCHHLVHRGLLHIAGNAVDGFVFTDRYQRPIRRRRRTGYRRAA